MPSGPKWRNWHKTLGLLILIAMTFLASCTNSTPFVEPLQNRPLSQPDYSPLQIELETYVQQQGGRIGIWFRDLRSGATFGVNEREPITAASTIKAPIVLYLYEQVAAGKEDLNTMVTYEPETDYADGAGVLQFFAPVGAQYSLGLLSNIAITISDNIAWRMLLRHLGRDNVARYFQSLGGEVIYPEGRNISTARDLGLYLQRLWDFSNEHPELGQRIIDYMSHTIFDEEGLPAGVPPEIPVAHKVGTVWEVAGDIGIVYLEDRPYILSVMTDGVGQSIDDGFEVVAEISKMVYEYQRGLAN